MTGAVEGKAHVRTEAIAQLATGRAADLADALDQGVMTGRTQSRRS
jgi:hypothetical protein